jgi:antitoxin component YwqK of YwqJK toxin-antitoxin module
MNKPLTFLLALTFLFLFSGFAFNDQPEAKREYWENGKMKSETHYRNGKRDGVSISWYVHGEKEYEGYYQSGKKNGVFSRWYESGAKEGKGSFKNDLPDGEFLGWHESGGGKLCLKTYKWKDGWHNNKLV